MARAFISYKHNVEPDGRLAMAFVAALTQQGHQVFIDKEIRVGQEWPTIIKRELEASDFLVLLLSSTSANSEMVIEEVRTADELRKQRGRPIILPIRIDYRDELPYDLGAKLNRIQYIMWEKEGDQDQIVEQLRTAMGQNSSFPGSPPDVIPAGQPSPIGGATPAQPAPALHPPLPAFDPRWLDRLEAPGGAVRLQSPFYIEREADEETKELILQDGVTIRVKGCRQSGKSSLLARLYQHARDHQQPSLYIDFQSLDKQQFQSLDTLLLALARLMAARLKTAQAPEAYWQTPLGVKDKLSLFIAEQVLPQAAVPLVLLLDEVDRVFSFAEYRDDFFSLIRYWHGQRAIEPCWEKLNIVLSYSSEAFMFITELNQSPFNVGYEFTLDDFTRAQVEELNRRHGSPLRTVQDTDRIMDMFHGHPYLTRRALYDLIRHATPLDAVIRVAADDDGPFADHLHRYLWWFQDHPGLREAMRTAIRSGSCATDEAFYRLRSAGLLRGTSRHDAISRCGLYTTYFEGHL